MLRIFKHLRGQGARHFGVRLIRNALLLGGVFLVYGASSVAMAQYRFDVLNTDNGLPQNSVYSILQTRDGYLWFTTLDGLVRYDGANYFVFNKANSPGINSNRFTRLFEDRDGVLWICTEDGGLTRFFNNTFKTYTTAHGLPHNWIFNLRQTESGDILIQTYKGLARWHDGQISIITTDLSSFDIILGYAGRSGAVWYRLGSTLRESRKGVTTDYTVPLYNPDDQNYPQLYEDREGRMWIGYDGPGLLMLKEGKLTAYTEKDGLPRALVTSFYEDRDGALWFGTYGGGLVKYEGGKFITFTTQHGLPGNSIVTIYEDHEGTLWVGTNASGLVRLGRQIIKAYTEKDGLHGKSFYPMLEDRAGNLWIGGEGLHRLRNGAFTYYPLNITLEARLSGAPFKRVSALYEDADGRLWIGSDENLFSFKDEQFTIETARFGLDSLKTFIYAIHRDRRGAMWFCTGDGLLEYQGSQFKRYQIGDGLPNNEVHAMLEDRKGALWFGTYGGLVRLAAGQFTAYTESDGLSSNRVRSLYEDGDGALWVGTYDGGLNRFKDDRFTRYNMSNGLFSNGVFAILEDDASNFWMSSNQGIYRVSRQQLNDFAEGRLSSIHSISYGKADGMHNTECNGGQQPAGLRARDGRLWFPTIDGVVVVEPRAVAFNAQQPPVVIERVLLDREVLPANVAVRITPGQESLEIHYAGLSFIKPEHARFRYRLEGLDTEWVEAGSRRVAFYSHLPAGTYVFRVIAANSDGVWNEQGATIQITVIPPVWRREWFVFLVAASLIATLALLVRARINKLQRARAAQEAFSRQLLASQEQERKRIATGLHDSLGQQLLVIKNWAMIELSVTTQESASHEGLNEISTTASQAIEEVREIIYDLRPYQLDKIGLASTIRFMVEKVAAACQIEFSVETGDIDNLFSYDAEITLYRIVQECVNNIIKHSQATCARVLIERHDRVINLAIEDNGCGFAPDAVGASDARRGGLGLTGMSERVRILGGKHAIESAPGAGTKIFISIQIEGEA
jgi:ligand-binding sensor domain-containing protein/signal transduction histidine kinase